MPSASIRPPALVRSQSSWSIAGAHSKHWATSLGNFGVTPFFGGNFSDHTVWFFPFIHPNAHCLISSVYLSKCSLSDFLRLSIQMLTVWFPPFVYPNVHFLISPIYLSKCSLSDFLRLSIQMFTVWFPPFVCLNVQCLISSVYLSNCSLSDFLRLSIQMFTFWFPPFIYPNVYSDIPCLCIHPNIPCLISSVSGMTSTDNSETFSNDNDFHWYRKWGCYRNVIRMR